MTTVYDVKASDLVNAAASRLKDMIKKPEYLNYVKSGADKERPPLDRDFWYIRNASILRQIYINGPMGVSRLRTRYGGRKQHVIHAHHHRKAGGSIISDSFRELEGIKFIKKTKEGRVITPVGRSFLDKISTDIAKPKA
jgi:small subunit ribosomal protein S19e